MPANDKQELRRAVRGRFPGEAERNAQSAALCRHVLDWEIYQRAQVIGGYMPMPHEADVTPILRYALASGKKLVLPRCGRKPLMQFHYVSDLAELVAGAYGLPEPAAEAPLAAPEEIGLLLVPLEALDRKGLRLGKGGGYYDNFISGYRGRTLGVLLQHQWVDALPADEWDQPLEAAADDAGIHLFG